MLRLLIARSNSTLISSSIARLIIDAALFLATFYGLRLFLGEDRRTPTFWATFSLASIVAALVTHSLFALQETFYVNTSFSAALWGSLRHGGAQGMAVYLAWALYWARSKRVRLTYGQNAFESPSDGTTSVSVQTT